MPEVTIVIGGRNFEVACREGEEHFLASAAAMLDEEARTLQESIGRVPESRMLLMAGLMLADKTAALEEQVSSVQSADAGAKRSATDGADLLELKAEVAKLKASLAEAEAKLAQAAAELAEKDTAAGIAKRDAAEAAEARDAAFSALSRIVDSVETAAQKMQKAV